MKELKKLKFQIDAVKEMLEKAEEVVEKAQAGRNAPALFLSAPTGSGKTLMAARFMEKILEDNTDARFLWLTDQPALNEQTKKKLVTNTTAFSPDEDNIVVIDKHFDQEVLKSGIVYFLNTQKLGSSMTLVTEDEDRDYLFWQTVANTIRDYPGSFWLVLDEAHRGMPT